MILFAALSLFTIWLVAESSAPLPEMVNVRVIASLRDLYKEDRLRR